MARANQFFNEATFSSALEAAEENAKTQTEMQFVSDMTQKVKEWGLEAFMSEAQAQWLQRIAGEGK